MSKPSILTVSCQKCRIANVCPHKGSSPLITDAGKRIHCNIVGGYGRTPIPRDILSEESMKLAEKYGPCMTIVELPKLDIATGFIYRVTAKVFSQPVLHEREQLTLKQKQTLHLINQRGQFPMKS